jgi:hypothetical protein
MTPILNKCTVSAPEAGSSPQTLADGPTVAEFAAVTTTPLRTVYRKLAEGKLRRLDGAHRPRLDPASFSPEAKNRWLEACLAQTKSQAGRITPMTIDSPRADSIVDPTCAPRATDASDIQQRFDFAKIPEDIKAAIAALRIPPEQAGLVQFRKELVTKSLNHFWRAEGYRSKSDWMHAETEKAHAAGIREISPRSIQRWTLKYQSEGIEGLIDLDPGPPPAVTGLEWWQFSYIEDRWREGMSPAQCLRAVLAETARRQAGCGLDHCYKQPTRELVEKVIRKLGKLGSAARLGAEAIKAACGHIRRSFLHLHSFDCVEADEWKFNLYAYDPEAPARVFRYWLLLFYDLRSIFPLAWKIVEGSDTDTRHGITQEDEIEVLEKLIREYGVPGALSTDRGRFRGNLWGGQAADAKRDKEFARADGILDALGVVHNLPRESNPRGMRIHPFFLYLSNCCQGLPGYIGRNTVEKKTTRGEQDKFEHLEWCKGNRSGARSAYLLSRLELETKLKEWIDWWREHPSRGTDMNGLSPRAVFVHETPPQGFRRLSEEDLAIAFAETFEEELIERGGVVTLPDHRQYLNPLLTMNAGELRTVKRLRRWPSFVFVLPTSKAEEVIVADELRRIGDDPSALAVEIERQKRMRELVARAYGRSQESSANKNGGTSQKSEIGNHKSEMPNRQPIYDLRPRLEILERRAEAAPPPKPREIPSLHELAEFEPTMEEL